jgi:alpha-ketoglutarate-dependent taurine dioxygenase
MTQAQQPAGRRVGPSGRKPIDLAQFEPVRERATAEDQTLPLVLEPAAEQVDLAGWIANNHATVERKLWERGGILFRGFGVKDATDFERVAGSICASLHDGYGDLPRAGVASRIYQSTPYPQDKAILYHNEGSHMSRWPTRINFFCLTVASEGGATPIVDCRKVYQGLDAPVRRAFEEKGLLYIRNFCGVDVSWQQFFGTDDRVTVERNCRVAGASCEWRGADHLRVAQRCEAVRQHPKTGDQVFFNQVQLHHVHCLDPATRESMRAMFRPDEYPRHVSFGDGTPIDDAIMDHVGEVYERHAVRFQWQPFDVVSLDNMLTAHARDPYVGPRKILVAMGDMLDASSI